MRKGILLPALLLFGLSTGFSQVYAATNLIGNPSMETAGSAGNPQGWFQDSWGTNTPLFTYPVIGKDGQKAVRVELTQATNGDAKWAFDSIPAKASTTYRFQDSYRSSVTSLLVAEYLSTSNVYSYFYLTDLPVSSTWATTSAWEFTTPANIKSLTVYHLISSVGFLETDDFVLEETNSTATPTATPLPSATPTAAPLPTAIPTLPPNPSVTPTPIATPVPTPVPPSANLLVNPGFEANSDWSKGFFTGSGTITRTTVDKHSGSYSYSIKGKTTTSSGQVYGAAINKVPVTAGKEYTFKAWYKGKNAYLVIKWLNASGAELTAARNNFGVSNATAWTQATKTAVAPTGAVKAWVFVQSRNNNQVTYFDDLEFYATAGSTPTPTPTATPVPTPIPTITPTPTPLPTVTPTPTPTTSIANPSLETGTTNNPTGWQQSSWGTNTTVFTYPVAGSQGSRAAKVDMSAYSSGDAKWFFNDVAIDPSKTYTISHDYNSSAITDVTIRYTLSNGTFSYQGMGQFPASNGWKTHTVQFMPVADAVSFTLFHSLFSVGSLTVDNYSLQNVASGAFNAGMVSLTFDDGWVSHHQNALPILQSANLKGTFYVNTVPILEGWSDYLNQSQLLSLQSAGFEIGSHTRTHAHLTQISDSVLKQELEGAQTELVGMGVTTPATLAYPYGEKDTRVITAAKAAGLIAARGVEYGYNTPITDKFDLKIQEVDVSVSLATIKGWIDQAKANKTWLILMFHQIDTSGGAYSTTPATLQSISDYINQQGVNTVTVKEGVALMQ